MQRWHITLGLATTTLFAAMLAPRLLGSSHPAPLASPPVDQPIVVAPAQVGALSLTAGLDMQGIQAGQTAERFVVLTVQAETPDRIVARRPVHLTVAMDTSGSMSSSDKLGQARVAAAWLIDQLHPEDSFALVTFDDDARIVIPPQQAYDKQRMKQVALGLQPGGGTNLYGGVQTAMDLGRLARPEAVQRMMVLSDGKATVGLTSPRDLRTLVGQAVERGTAVSTFGLGIDYDEDLLMAMADAGGGAYAYISSGADLRQTFASELDEATSLVARGAALSLSPAPGVELLEVLGWSANMSSGSATVFLGDVPAGATRTIVARVRVHGQNQPTQQVLAGTLSYQDLTREDFRTAQVNPMLTLVDSVEAVAASEAEAYAAPAQRAWAWTLADRAARAYEKGDQQQAMQYNSDSEQVLRTAATRYQRPALAAEASAVSSQRGVYQSAAPTSAAGKAALKMSKEASRDNAR